MALTYSYPDEYLSKRVDEDRELRAIEEVATLDITDADYIKKLTILKAYIITSLECSSDSEDIFSTKYKIYSKEYNATLTQAIESKKSDLGLSLFSVELGRN